MVYQLKYQELNDEFEKRKVIGKFSERANKLLTRDYRKPFVVPERV